MAKLRDNLKDLANWDFFVQKFHNKFGFIGELILKIHVYLVKYRNYILHVEFQTFERFVQIKFKIKLATLSCESFTYPLSGHA